MIEDYCTICGCENPQELKNHDPAFHVVRAYHKEKDGKCVACGEEWECVWVITYRDYSEFWRGTRVESGTFLQGRNR